MAPVVRISEQTWERMQQYAKPLVDTPDSVINAALDALDAASGEIKKPKNILAAITEQSRQQKGELTPQRDFRRPLLNILLQLGGKASTTDIRNSLQKRLVKSFKAGDLEQVSSGEIRWWNAVCWERADLIRENLFREDSPRGIWELTEQGKKEARRPIIV
jgi:hypothetical protein